MTVTRLLAPALLLLATAMPLPAQAQAGDFKVTPYLQLGPKPGPDTLQLLWHTLDATAQWSVEWRRDAAAAWQSAAEPTNRVIAAEGTGTRYVWRSTMAGLPTGQRFEYRVRRNGATLFQAEAKAPKGPAQPYTFVAIGDIGVGETPQRELASLVWGLDPDLVVVPGDIVYDVGSITEYDRNFWPVYNAAQKTKQGVPLMHRVPMVAAPGNHDLTEYERREPKNRSGVLAYYMFWDQPLNGPPAQPDDPLMQEGGPLVRKLQLTALQIEQLKTGAGPAYPRMANFSFDYGDTHWLVLNANPNVNWSNEKLQAWVRQDLADAPKARWRLVLFHQPAYQSSSDHFDEQQMRALSHVLQQGGVDLVITGHVHNYQRTHPLLCERADRKPGDVLLVDYRCTPDKAYDGKTKTRPKGVIHIVTGAGGAGLYDMAEKSPLQDYTAVYKARRHSLTRVEVTKDRLHVRQLDANGDEVDTFTITR